MPTLSWSALYVANSAFSHPGASPDDCTCPTMRPVHNGLASEAALQSPDRAVLPACPCPLLQDLVFRPCQIYFAGFVEHVINRDFLHTHVVGARALAIIVSVNAGAAR